MKRLWKILILFILLIIGALVYATYVGTTGLITKEYVLSNNNLPLEYDGFKVVHFSDLHFNRGIDEKELDNIVNEINLINADVVVFTGDLIDKDLVITDDDYKIITKAFKKIYAKYGKYSVLGNHDYSDEDNILKVFKDSDFKYLENSYETILSSNNENIYIMGLGNVINNLDDVDKISSLIKDSDGFKIMLVHEPDISDEIIDNIDVDLILGGHSHNGQVRLPFVGALYTPKGAKKYYDEYYKVNDTDIYVSSGIGVSNVNMRLFNRPSINFYRINK